jgi:hypothetical protein
MQIEIHIISLEKHKNVAVLNLLMESQSPVDDLTFNVHVDIDINKLWK